MKKNLAAYQFLQYLIVLQEDSKDPDLGLCLCLLTVSVDTVVNVEEQNRSRLDCTDAHADLNLLWLQIA